MEIMAPYKRNKTIYGGSKDEDEDKEEEDGDDNNPGPSRSRDKITAMADVDPLLPDRRKYKRGVKPSEIS